MASSLFSKSSLQSATTPLALGLILISMSGCGINGIGSHYTPPPPGFSWQYSLSRSQVTLALSQTLPQPSPVTVNSIRTSMVYEIPGLPSDPVIAATGNTITLSQFYADQNYDSNYVLNFSATLQGLESCPIVGYMNNSWAPDGSGSNPIVEVIAPTFVLSAFDNATGTIQSIQLSYPNSANGPPSGTLVVCGSAVQIQINVNEEP